MHAKRMLREVNKNVPVFWLFQVSSRWELYGFGGKFDFFRFWFFFVVKSMNFDDITNNLELNYLPNNRNIFQIKSASADTWSEHFTSQVNLSIQDINDSMKL